MGQNHLGTGLTGGRTGRWSVAVQQPMQEVASIISSPVLFSLGESRKSLGSSNAVVPRPDTPAAKAIEWEQGIFTAPCWRAHSCERERIAWQNSSEYSTRRLQRGSRVCKLDIYSIGGFGGMQLKSREGGNLAHPRTPLDPAISYAWHSRHSQNFLHFSQ